VLMLHDAAKLDKTDLVRRAEYYLAESLGKSTLGEVLQVAVDCKAHGLARACKAFLDKNRKYMPEKVDDSIIPTDWLAETSDGEEGGDASPPSEKEITVDSSESSWLEEASSSGGRALAASESREEPDAEDVEGEGELEGEGGGSGSEEGRRGLSSSSSSAA